MSTAHTPGAHPVGGDLGQGGQGGDVGRPPLSRWSMFAFGWWLAVVAGLALVAWAVIHTVPELVDADAAFWVIVGLVLLGELRPVI
ncbi:MAG TPA: hypothetical protein VMT27_01135, partial [Actinomycetes bacterium]|nr:hypothetical protein [Actinomycetes bacterium]